MSTIRSSGLISIAFPGVSTPLLAVPTGMKSVIRKIMWTNRTGGNGYLRIGYIDIVGAAFQQVLPDILMIGGPAIEDQLVDPNLPICGNAVDGFCLDINPLAGSTGVIVAQSTVAGAAPNDVQVELEVEEL